MIIEKIKEAKEKIEKFKLKNDRYPLYVKDFTVSNELMTSFNGLSLGNIKNIQDMYKKMYKSDSFYDYQYILNEVKLHLTGQSKKTTRLSVLQNDERYKKVMLFLFTYFKNYKGYYPEYKDFENTYYFPFIVGINDEKDLSYEKLFSEKNINDYINSKEYDKISKVINEEKVKLSQKEYLFSKEKTNPDNKKAEETIVNITNICIKNKIKKIEKKEDLYNLLIKNKINSNELNFLKRNAETIFKDINSLLSLIKNNDYPNTKILDLNNEINNNKGYDFLIKNNNEKIFINYKFVKGRTSSNLSLYKILGIGFSNILKISPETYSKAEKFILKIDNFVFEEYLKKLFFELIEYIFVKYKNQGEYEGNLKEDIYIFIEKLKTDKKMLNLIDKNIKLKNNKFSIEDFSNNVLNVINKEVVKVLTKNNINNISMLIDKEKSLKNDILENLYKIKFLKSSILYENFNQENYKKEYKEIIRVFYRDNELIKNVNASLFPHNENYYDKEIFKIFQENFIKLLSIKEERMKQDPEEKKDFLKYILHLEFNDDNPNSKGVILQNGVLIDTLSYESIKDKIKDIDVKIDNIKRDSLGYIFDLDIIYKNTSILKFNKNYIKSSEGKFLDYFRVEFSTNIDFNSELIKKFNTSLHSSNKPTLEE